MDAPVKGYRVGIEGIAWGVVVLSADGTALELMNPAFVQMHGYTVEELTGRPIADVIASAERSKLPEYTRIINEKGHYIYESMHIRKDGSVFPVLVDAAAVKDDTGKVLYRAVHVRDVSEQKRQEEALCRSERFLQSTINALRSHIAILDESGVIIFVNEAWRRFAEANQLNLSDHGLGTNYLKVCESAEGEDAPLAQEALNGLKALLDFRQDVFTLEYPCHSPTEKRWFNMRATRFMDGDSPRVVVAHLDITKEKLAEKMLQDREMRHLRAEEIGQFGHWDRNLIENTAAWSKGMYRIFGQDPAQIKPTWKHFMHLVHPQDRDMLKNAIETAISTGEKVDLEYCILRPDGSQRVVHSIAEPGYDAEGKPVRVFGLLCDVTDLREKESLLKKRERELQDKTAELEDINTTLRVLLKKREEDREKLKEQLLANIKELVEPYLEKLKKSRLSKRQKSYLDIVDQNLKEVVMPSCR